MERSKLILAPGISKGNLVNLESGRIPPQAIDLEEAVIGAMLIDKKGVDEVIDILTSNITKEAEATQKETFLTLSLLFIFAFGSGVALSI